MNMNRMGENKTALSITEMMCMVYIKTNMLHVVYIDVLNSGLNAKPTIRRCYNKKGHTFIGTSCGCENSTVEKL